MATKRIPVLNLEDATFIKRNFSGKKEKFNEEGKRYCLVRIPENMVDNLKDMGWNIKSLPVRDEDDDPTYFIKVNVRYDNVPPNVFIVRPQKEGKPKLVRLTEYTIKQLDWSEISSADIIITPYTTQTGAVSAYLKTMYVNVIEDAFAYKYEMEGFADEECPFE